MFLGFRWDWRVCAAIGILQSHYFVLVHCHKAVGSFISTLSHCHLRRISGLKIKDIHRHMSERILRILPRHQRAAIITPGSIMWVDSLI